jgi:hypothetical protein
MRIDYARAEMVRDAAAEVVLGVGGSFEDAKRVSERAYREVLDDERNGRLNAFAGHTQAGGPKTFDVTTYTGRHVDPLADYSLDTCSTLD